MWGAGHWRAVESNEFKAAGHGKADGAAGRFRESRWRERWRMRSEAGAGLPGHFTNFFTEGTRAEGRMLEHVVTLIARMGGMWTVQWPTRGQGTAERSFKVQY